jgi:NAD(P)-dependent dehydrogenase (short-subunit alcohol dehydrogenase family)
MGWTEAELPRVDGRVVLVTGGNSGLGLQSVRVLASKGARVLLACRSAAKGEEAAAAVRAAVPDARIDVVALDLADLGSVRSLPERLPRDVQGLDVLMNNAGVMAIPRTLTRDGFEMQLGTNHLGHFALLGVLADRLLDRPGARIVTVSSGVHWGGHVAFDDLMGERSYSKWTAYSQSKLANLLFHFALARRLAAKGRAAIAVAAHPGYTATNLQVVSANSDPGPMGTLMTAVGNRFFAQSVEMGALPQLAAAIGDDVASGDYFGPWGPFEAWGAPKKCGCSARARDEAAQERLWEVSSALVGGDPLP